MYLSGRVICCVKKSILRNSKLLKSIIERKQSILLHLDFMRISFSNAEAGKYKNLLNEINRKQNLYNGLSYVSAESFEFFVMLEFLRKKCTQ